MTDESKARLLSNREAAAVAAVRTHYAEVGRPPSYKEIGARLGVRTSQADRLVKSAATLGSLFVVRRPGQRTQVRLAVPLAEVATIALATELAARSNAPEPLPRPGNNRETNRARLAA